jgi:hypothetical protein
LSLNRPWTRGAVWLPEGAPRIPISPQPGPLAAPRYPIKEWSYTHGFGYFYAASGWAQYDRHFVQWAEREGYAFDMITQTDLHYRPEILAACPCVLIVGHDEYWSFEMRSTIERHVEQGGRLARFGGNFLGRSVSKAMDAARFAIKIAPAPRIPCGTPKTPAY